MLVQQLSWHLRGVKLANQPQLWLGGELEVARSAFLPVSASCRASAPVVPVAPHAVGRGVALPRAVCGLFRGLGITRRATTARLPQDVAEAPLLPSALSQALQSPQSSHAQSCGWQSAEQGVRKQPSTSLSASTQGRPPKAGNATMSRERVLEPPPQLAVQSPHSSQDPTWQSRAGPVPQPNGLCCPGPGLHGAVCFMGPTQNAPSPRPWRAMLRDRRMTPSQSLVQSLHAPQSAKRQSTDSTHETSLLQLAVDSRVAHCGAATVVGLHLHLPRAPRDTALATAGALLPIAPLPPLAINTAILAAFVRVARAHLLLAQGETRLAAPCRLATDGTVSCALSPVARAAAIAPVVPITPEAVHIAAGACCARFELREFQATPEATVTRLLQNGAAPLPLTSATRRGALAPPAPLAHHAVYLVARLLVAASGFHEAGGAGLAAGVRVLDHLSLPLLLATV
eukprot:CAMPEP_0171087504 /NCGR_PEP_ID=MMETSP0766_2-20121228/20193_1 /TAXON_ID=439317 /ORGANISM="Gambierdiscus australes, Strain CAWD 149" /LENGTH=455 /DNA_ID=CAMNT_0011545215 /DNA_START=283 /DNA_END=1646 /DNA_ORIENTATION=-